MFDLKRLDSVFQNVDITGDMEIFNKVSDLRGDGREAKSLIESAISDVFKSEESAKSIKKLAFHYNFINEIAFWLSDFFNKGISVTAKKEGVVDDKLTEYVNRFLTGPRFDVALAEAEQMSNIMGTALVEVQPRIEGELGVDFNVMHGGDFWAVERYDNARIAEAIAVGLGHGGVYDSLFPSDDVTPSYVGDTSSRGAPVSISGDKRDFICVTKNDYFIYTSDGFVIPVGSNKSTKNPFGYYTSYAPAPFCCLHSRFTRRFLNPPPVGLMDFDILNSVSIAELSLLHKLQTYSIATFFNAKAMGNIEIGPDVALYVETNGENLDTDFKFVTPNPKLREGKEFVREVLSLFGKTFGISPTDMNVEGVAESGFAVRVKRAALDKRLNALRGFRRIFLDDILRVIKDCNNKCLKGRKGFVEIPEDVELGYVLPDLVPLETEIERRTRLETDRLFCLTSPKELVKDKFKTLSDAEAKSIAEENTKEWAEIDSISKPVENQNSDTVVKPEEQVISQPKSEVDTLKEDKVGV